MGFLDKLFGRKEKEQAKSPAPASYPSSSAEFHESVSDYLKSLPHGEADHDKVDLEPVISRNPYAARYRSASAQTNINITTLDYIPFYMKSEGRFVALDLETTGLDYHNDSIIEICAVRVDDGRITETYHQYVNPDRHVPPAASAVNHITDDMLIDKPRIYEILPNLLHFIGSDIIVAHNAPFDVHFLASACMLYRFIFPVSWFDSRDLKTVWPDLPNQKLQSFLDAAGVVNNHPHSAIGDAEALAQLMIVSMQKPFHAPIPEDIVLTFSTGHFSGAAERIDDSLSGKRFVLTGEIPGRERYDVEELIAKHGGRSTLKISDATDFLVRGVFSGLPPVYMSAKEVYARKLIAEGGKIRIISPDELFSMMNE